MTASIVTVDVRKDLAQGIAPFTKIMQAVDSLKNGDKLLLIAPFKPTLLFAIMAQRGFRHEAKPTLEGNWEVLFACSAKPVCFDQNAASSPSPPVTKRQTVKIDVRGLEPSQPLVMILEAVSTLSETAELQACTDRKPTHLYDELLQRGFSGQTEEREDGSFLTIIRRI